MHILLPLIQIGLFYLLHHDDRHLAYTDSRKIEVQRSTLLQMILQMSFKIPNSMMNTTVNMNGGW